MWFNVREIFQILRRRSRKYVSFFNEFALLRFIVNGFAVEANKIEMSPFVTRVHLSNSRIWILLKWRVISCLQTQRRRVNAVYFRQISHQFCQKIANHKLSLGFKKMATCVRNWTSSTYKITRATSDCHFKRLNWLNTKSYVTLSVCAVEHYIWSWNMHNFERIKCKLKINFKPCSAKNRGGELHGKKSA